MGKWKKEINIVSKLDKYKDPRFNENNEDEKISKKDLVEFLKNNLTINVENYFGYAYISLKFKDEDLPFSQSLFS